MSASIILLAILGLSLLVIVHEAGHYFAARAFGMRVTQFSIGFGPSLFSFTPKGSDTTFQLRAIPFMAYVVISGMNPAEEFDPNDPHLYPNKSVFARIVTISPGPSPTTSRRRCSCSAWGSRSAGPRRSRPSRW